MLTAQRLLPGMRDGSVGSHTLHASYQGVPACLSGLGRGHSLNHLPQPRVNLKVRAGKTLGLGLGCILRQELLKLGAYLREES